MNSNQSDWPPWAIGPFTRPHSGNPVIEPDPESSFFCPMYQEAVNWEALHTFNPCAVVHNGEIHLLYRAEDNRGEMSIGGHTSRIGMAISADGVGFQRFPEPVLYPASDDESLHEHWGGCEDPRITSDRDGLYILTYTQYARVKERSFTSHNLYWLGVATSRDLKSWVKHGPAFAAAYEGRHAAHTKSGAIISRLVDGNLRAEKIRGKYWMYFGVDAVHMAFSEDLINWTPLVSGTGELVRVLETRRGRFDSGLNEVGPAALLTDNGIVLIYNGMNSREGDPRFHERAYCGGQALFDADTPDRCVGRLDDPFIYPELDYEQRGQYPGGTTFTEGLVAFNGTWYLYYGCADSLVAVAMADCPQTENRST